MLKAAEAVAGWHADQKSKGEGGAPYVNHLLEVASLSRRGNRGDGPEPDHRIEDQDVARHEIERRFNEDVASLVEEVTDDKSIPSQERKRLQVEQAPRKSRRAKILKLADKISSKRALGTRSRCRA